MDGSGWEWVGVGGSGWEWVVVGGKGWEWVRVGLGPVRNRLGIEEVLRRARGFLVNMNQISWSFSLKENLDDQVTYNSNKEYNFFFFSLSFVLVKVLGRGRAGWVGVVVEGCGRGVAEGVSEVVVLYLTSKVFQ